MATDKLRKASSGGVANVATVASARATGETTLAISTGGLTNWSSTTSVDFNTYTLTAGVASNMCSWTGRADLDNDIITELELTSGEDVGNAKDDVVVCVETAAWVNDTIDTLLSLFDSTGAIKPSSVPSSAIVNEAVGTTKIADDAVTTVKVADDNITAAKLINGIVKSRQGGSASDWSTIGTTTYDVSAENVITQCGTKAPSGLVTGVVFPTEFTNPPLVIASPTGSGTNWSSWYVVSVTKSGFSFVCSDYTKVTSMNWVAVGI